MTSGRTLTARPKPARSAEEAAADEVAEAPVPIGAGTTATKGQNLQDQFLNLLRKHKVPVTMFLVKGVKLQGIITWFDNFYSLFSLASPPWPSHKTHHRTHSQVNAMLNA